MSPIVPVSIAPISGPISPNVTKPAGEASTAGGFQDILTGAIGQIESISQNASVSVEHFLSGDGEDLHTTVLATQRAELAFEMFQQVRNKVVSAYQEVMRMQI